MTADTNHTTQHPSDESQFKPQTYEEWKTAHGWQPEAEPRLEIGQRVKATSHMSEDDDWLVKWDLDRKPERVPKDTEGTVTNNDNGGLYTVAFDNGCTWVVAWDEDEDFSEITTVGKSPSELAYEQSERERLSAWRQLSLFDAAQTGGAS